MDVLLLISLCVVVLLIAFAGLVIVAIALDKEFKDADEAENLNRLKVIKRGQIRDDQCN